MPNSMGLAEKKTRIAAKHMTWLDKNRYLPCHYAQVTEKLNKVSLRDWMKASTEIDILEREIVFLGRGKNYI